METTAEITSHFLKALCNSIVEMKFSHASINQEYESVGSCKIFGRSSSEKFERNPSNGPLILI